MSSRSLGTLTIDILAKTGNLTQGMSKAAREVDNDAKRIRRSLEQNVSQGANSATDALNRFSAQVISIAAAWRGLSAGIAAADTWTNFNNRLRLVTDGQQGFVAAQENVLRIAKESRQPLAATAELYQRIATNQKELGLSGQEVADIVQTISKSMVISGASAQASEAALVQLGQAFASGTLRGQELNSVMEQAPALARAIANGLGVPIGKLRELSQAGELSADAVITALQSQSEAVAESFSRIDSTVAQAMTNVRTNLTELIGRFSEATGAASGLASAISALGNNLPQVATAFAAFASVKVSQHLADRVRVFRETQASLVAQTRAELANAQAIELKTRAALLDAQAEVRRAQAIGGSVAVSAQAAQATLAHRQAIIALESAQLRAAAASNVLGRAAGSVLGFFGGPAGIALMVATTAASWLLFRDNTDKATQALIDFNGTADESIRKFDELNRAQQAGEMLRLSDEIAEGAKSIGESIALLSNEADFTDLYDTFGESLRKLQREFDSGEIGADEFANSVSDLGKRLADTGQVEEVQRRGIINYAAAIGNAAREVERKNQILDVFTGKQRDAANAVDGNTQAIRDQAAALAAGQKSLSDYIGKMDQMINQGVVSIVRKTKGEFAALQVEVGQMINAAGGIDALDPRQREAINQYLATRREQIRIEKEADAANKAASGGRRGRTDAQRAAEQALREQQKARDELRKQIEAVTEARSEFDAWAAQLAGPMAQANYQFAVDLERLNELARKGEIEADRLAEAQGRLRAEHEANVEAIKRQLDPFGRLLEDYEFENELMRMGSVEREVAIALRQMEGKATEEQTRKLREQIKANQELAESIQFMDGVRNEFSSFFTDVITGAESVTDAFKSMMDNIARMITQRIADRWVEQLFGDYGSSAGGSAGGWFSALMGIFGGGKAAGGWAQANTIYEVNERGLEMATVKGRDYLLTGNSPVHITPNHQLSGGGGSLVQNFYNPVMANQQTDAQRAREEARKAQRALARV